MTPHIPTISIFDIHLILQRITSDLTAQDIEHCRLVSKSWLNSFHPFRRITAKWSSPLTLSEHNRLWDQAPTFWTLDIPLDDPAFDPLIQSNRFVHLRELTCLGRCTYEDRKDLLHKYPDYLFDRRYRCWREGPPWDWLGDLTESWTESLDLDTSIYEPFDTSIYDLPGKVQKLVETADKLESLTIQHDQVPYCPYRPDLPAWVPEFSTGMLKALAEHKTLATLILNSRHMVDVFGLLGLLDALPETIESFELTVDSHLRINGWDESFRPGTMAPITTFKRLEPYLRLKRLAWKASMNLSLVPTLLIPFLRFCPRLQEFEMVPSEDFHRAERALADTLLEFCPEINSLDLRRWQTFEQMRLVRGYALQKLRIFDYILNGDVNPELEELSSTKTTTIPCLTRSNKTLQVLDLSSTGNWTPSHDLDAILLQFPNLKELTMDWFDLDQVDPVAPMTISTKLEKLHLLLLSRPSEQNPLQDRTIMIPAPNNGMEDEVVTIDGHYEEEEEEVEDRRRNPWNCLLSTNELDLSVPFHPWSKRQSPVSLAPKIARLSQLLSRIRPLQDCLINWGRLNFSKEDTSSTVIVKFDFEDTWGSLDIRGPLMDTLIMDHKLNKKALQQLHVRWTEFPNYTYRKQQLVTIGLTDPKLKARGFLVTDIESAISSRRKLICEPTWEGIMESRILAARAEAQIKKDREEWDREEEDRRLGNEPEYVLYKSRNKHRTRGCFQDKKLEEKKKAEERRTSRKENRTKMTTAMRRLNKWG